MPVKVSIAAKIFGLAVFLLCLTIALTAFLLWQVTELNNELRVIAKNLIPLQRSIANVNDFGLRRRLAFERLYGAYLSGRVGSDVVAEATTNYKLYTDRSDSEIGNAKKLLDSNARSAAYADKKAGIRALLNQVEDNYKLVLAQQNEVLALAREGQRDRAETIRPFLSDLQRQTQNVRQQIHMEMSVVANNAADAATDRQARVVRLAMATTATTVLLGLILAWLITKRLVDPVWRLMAGMKSVEEGDLSVELPVRSQDEVGQLTGSFNYFVRELRSKEQIKQTFGKYIDPRILERVILQPGGRDTAGERRVMTVSFSDMVGFTAIGEQLTPGAMVNVLNRYFGLQGNAVQHHGGVVDKFIGDALMAFWGPPFTDAKEHAYRACCAALDQRKSLETLRAELPEITGLRRSPPQVDMRIGVNTGEVIVGTIGSENARSYTVIGDAVNLSSRLEGANKIYGTSILVSEHTWDLVGRKLAAREVDSIFVKGKSEPTRVYELLGVESELPGSALRIRDRFSPALEAYRRQDWERAEKLFESCLEIDPRDRPARMFLSRISLLRDQPPGDAWNGVWHLEAK